MPELPEVETIRRQLAEKIISKRLHGKKIVGVRRRAKLLFIDFDDGSSLVFHLKLTGQIIFQGRPSKYTRKVFCFDDGSRLVFNDARKFGWFKEVKDTSKIEEEFGPEPLTLVLKTFSRLLSKRPRSKIKPLLMNQKFIAGIGNIYADEILFAAGVQPTRPAGTLTDDEIKKIFVYIGKILNKAIEQNGSSVEYYLDACGRHGSYTQFHKVYQKERCQKCGAKIKKIRIGSRSAHFCAICQK